MASDLAPVPDIMNDAEFDHRPGRNNETHSDNDTCRICRIEGTTEQPLFYPCKCSGSIKFVHQTCLMDWLAHSQKKHCELCKTPFRFTKLYHPDMPKSLPFSVFIRRASLHTWHAFLAWCRGGLVALVWLVWLPWSMRFVWWGLFYLADGSWIQMLEELGQPNVTLAMLPPKDAPAASKTILQTAKAWFASVSHYQDVFTSWLLGYASRDNRVASFINGVWPTLLRNGTTNSASNITLGVEQRDEHTTGRQASGSLLSGIPLFDSLTPNPTVNKLITDILEGQIITLCVIVAFALVFLIREWVVQQQPVLDLAEDNGGLEEPAIPQPVPRNGDLPQADLNQADREETEVSPTWSVVNSEDISSQGDSTSADSSEPRPARPAMPSRSQSPNPAEIRRIIEEIDSESQINAGNDPSNELQHEELADLLAVDLEDTSSSGEASTSQFELEEGRTGEQYSTAAEPDGLIDANATLPQAAQNQGEVPSIGPQPPRGLADALFDWFFGDVVDTENHGNNPDNDDERILDDLAAEAPFVPFIDARPERQHDAADQNALIAAHDVGAARNVANANNQDGEFADDVEDFEGMLELLGMQGPIIGLFQNSIFCAIIASSTVATGVWLPYLWGKVSFFIIAEPMHYLVAMPAQIISSFSNIAIDFLIFTAAQLLVETDGLMRSAVSVLVSTFPFLSWPSVNNRVTVFCQGAATAAVQRSGKAFSALSWYNPISNRLHPQTTLQAFRIVQMRSLGHIQLIQQWTKNVETYIISSSWATLYKQSLQLVKRVPQTFLHIYAQMKDSAFWLSAMTPGWGHISDGGLSEVVPNSGWTIGERTIAIIAGYALFGLIGAALLRFPMRNPPRQWQRIHNAMEEVFQQAGGIAKVILIISIEMLVFPLYCGLLLDTATLPLFNSASFTSRCTFAFSSPWTALFAHWFIGTCYMFHFALFVSMCRGILRKGVLYFIRDPDDPTFHPVRDVLERSIASQISKIAFSAFIYGAIVIMCFGSIIYIFSTQTLAVFPLRWKSSQELMDFPIDLLLYNIFAPLVIRTVHPSNGVGTMYKWWFLKCSDMLRLTQFLIGDRDDSQKGLEALQRDGRYMRVPASDTVRFPRGQSVFLEVDSRNNRIDGQHEDPSPSALHGRLNPEFELVWIPPWFRVRVALFITSIWALTAFAGLVLSVIPLVLGRGLFTRILPTKTYLNDVYNFSVGIGIMAAAYYTSRGAVAAGRNARRNFEVNNQAVKKAASASLRFTLRALRILYAYGVFAVVIPSILALLVEFYLVMPLSAYANLDLDFSNHSAASSTSAYLAMPTSALRIPKTTPFLASVTSHTVQMQGGATNVAATGGMLQQHPHIVHFLQDYTLGLLYMRIILRVTLLFPDFPLAVALRRLIENRWADANVRIVTRCFLLPAMIVGGLTLGIPALIGQILLRTVFRHEAHHEMFSILLMRFTYPLMLGIAMAMFLLWQVGKVALKWRTRVRDEVYLIGERLHNFGELRPPRALSKGKAVSGDWYAL